MKFGAKRSNDSLFAPDFAGCSDFETAFREQLYWLVGTMITLFGISTTLILAVRCQRNGPSARPAAEAVECSAVTFGGTSRSAFTGEDRLRTTLRGWRAVVDVAIRRDRCTHSLVDQAGHLHDPESSGDAGLDPIADSHPGRRLCGDAVDAHVSSATTLGCGRPGL